MQVITVAGPPSSGKTAVLLWALKGLRSRGLRCGVAKFDCLGNDDADLFRGRGFPALAGISDGQCPDHYYATNVSDVCEWGREQDLDLLFIETAGLCNRCSPHLKGSLSMCVLDALAGVGAPAKIGPYLRCADIVAITKGDIISQAEREVFALTVGKLAPKAFVMHVNGVTGQGVQLLVNKMAVAPAMDDPDAVTLRCSMPSAVCSFCIGETRVGRRHQSGNIVPLRDDGLPPLRLTALTVCDEGSVR